MKDGLGDSPLDLALEDMDDRIDDGFIDVALYLINRGCGDDEDKNKLLCGSCRRGRLDMVKELVEEHNCDPKSECCVHIFSMCVILRWWPCTVLLYRKDVSTKCFL